MRPKPATANVRQTACRYCGQDIENFSPYRKGEWRDRGNNPTCPTKAGDRGLHHAPHLEGHEIKVCSTCKGPMGARAIKAGAEVCSACDKETNVDVNHTVTVPIVVKVQRLRDLLCSAVEGGSNYWATFDQIERTPDLDYISVRVSELEASGDKRIRRVMRAEGLAKGLKALAAAEFPAAGSHLANFLSENDDAETADVVLQMAIFGDLVYG